MRQTDMTAIAADVGAYLEAHENERRARADGREVVRPRAEEGHLEHMRERRRG